MFWDRVGRLLGLGSVCRGRYKGKGVILDDVYGIILLRENVLD